MSRVFIDFKSFEDSFVDAGTPVSKVVIIGETTYLRASVGASTPDKHVVVYEADDGSAAFELSWALRGTLMVPCEVTKRGAPTTAVVESVAECTMEGATCALLEHHASVGGVMLQVDIDETLTQPRLYLSESALDLSQKDPDSVLPHMARLTLNDQTVYVYEHNGSLTLPTVVVETANGTVLHNVIVEVSSSECPHLSLPPNLIPRSLSSLS